MGACGNFSVNAEDGDQAEEGRGLTSYCECM